MFQSEQKQGKDSVKNENTDAKNSVLNINPAEMLREQYKALQRNSGNALETMPAVQMKEDEEEETEILAENEAQVNNNEEAEQNDNDEQDNNSCSIVNEAGEITITLYDNTGNTHEKTLNLNQVRENNIIRNLNWNAIIRILEFASDEIDDFNYIIPTNLTGTEEDNTLIIPDAGVLAILKVQANNLIEQNDSTITNNNFQTILNGIDGWPGNTFASFMGEESINNIRDEGNNTGLVNEDDEEIEIPDFDSDGEETLYDFMRDITLARNGLWSDNDNIVNLTGLRRELEISEEEDHLIQWNDTMAACWIETDEDGNQTKFCKHYTATTEPGNRDSNRMIAPQTVIMRLGLHHGRQPAGRLLNPLIIDSDNNNNLYDFDNDNSAGMNVHPGGFINNQRGGMGLTNNALNGFSGQFGSEVEEDVLDLLYLSEIFYILSRYGVDRQDSAYNYLVNKKDEAIEIQQNGNDLTDEQQAAINDFNRIDTILSEDVFTEARENYIKNTVEFDADNEEDIYEGNINGYNAAELDDDSTEISGNNQGARVGLSSEGCQVIFGGKSFYDFWWNALNKASDSAQRRWYYTVINITTPYNDIITEEGEINE